MTQELQDRVVVVTGASSGIGRATSLAFAASGARIVLASRREQALQEVATEIGQHGGEALVVPTDVTDPAQVERLAEQAINSFGHVDIWVNNAGVSTIGLFQDVPLEEMRRIFETDVMGVVHGTRAILPVFLAQQFGTLINVASIVSVVPQPYASAYVAAKAAVRGLSASLRQEVGLQGAKRVHIVTILPAVIDTPFFTSAGNHAGKAIQPPPPVNSPQVVAEAIVNAAIQPRREVIVGRGGRTMAMQMKLMPGLTERVFARSIEKTHFGAAPSVPTSGNLFSPPENNGAISGGWQSASHDGSPARRARKIGGAALGLLGVMAWRRRR